MLEIAHVKVMVSSGCTVQQIAAVVEAHLAVEYERLLARRVAGRQRQHRYMEKLKQNQQSADASVTVSDDHQPTEKEIPPTPPKEKPSLLLPVTSLRSVTATVRGELFGRGANWLSEFTGKPLGSVKSLIGRWLKDSADEAHRVLAAVDHAKQDQIAEPIAWISASLKPSKIRKSRDTAYAALDRIDAIADPPSYHPSSRLSLGAPIGKIVPFNQQRDHGGNDRLDGADLHAVSRKPVEGDLLPLDRDACQF